MIDHPEPPTSDGQVKLCKDCRFSAFVMAGDGYCDAPQNLRVNRVDGSGSRRWWQLIGGGIPLDNCCATKEKAEHVVRDLQRGPFFADATPKDEHDER